MARINRRRIKEDVIYAKLGRRIEELCSQKMSSNLFMATVYTEVLMAVTALTGMSSAEAVQHIIDENKEAKDNVD